MEGETPMWILIYFAVSMFSFAGFYVWGGWVALGTSVGSWCIISTIITMMLAVYEWNIRTH